MERKLTAILCADVFGYSSLMGEDEEATLRTLSSHRKIIDGLIEQHRGRFVNSAGDSVLAEFASVVNAVQCAVDVQTTLKERGFAACAPDEVPHRRQPWRRDARGRADLRRPRECRREAGESCGTKRHLYLWYRSRADTGQVGAWLRGPRRVEVKNIARPVHVWRVLLDGAAVPRGARRISRSYGRGGVLSLTGLAIIVGTIVLGQHLSLKPPHTHASIPSQEKSTLPLPDKPSIAALPFVNMSSDPQQEYFSDGITDQIINDLSRLPGLLLIARNCSFSSKGKATKEQEIGKELGVRYVLEGSARKAADRLRIGVELIDASTGTEMRTQRYDRPIKDIFALQDEIVGRVVSTLGLLLSLEQ